MIETIAPSPPTHRLAEEIASLPPSRILAGHGPYTVHLVRGGERPTVLYEVGRQREIAFRAVGEGTGEALDLDGFDGHYDHLVLWHADRGIVGAYRLAFLPDVLATHGLEGLYTSTLFDYPRDLALVLGEAVELGRCFVRADHQRGSPALALLWRGIAAYVAMRPGCRHLFGACSIDRGYPDEAILLVLGHLAVHRCAADLVPLVRPRNPWLPRCPDPRAWTGDGARIATTDALERRVSEIDPAGRGLPVLLKQYLRLGADVATSNVDPSFGDVVDVFVRLDLERADARRLSRFSPRAEPARAAS